MLAVPPSPDPPPWPPQVSLCESVSVLWIVGVIFQIPHVSDVILYLSDLLCKIISSCIHVSANDSISFFLRAEYLPLSEKAVAPTPVRLPGKSHGQRSLVGCSPWGH